MSNLTALFALYPRFYFIKSAYGNSEYRFLIGVGDKPPPFHLKGSLKDNFQAAFAVIRYNTLLFY
ncbi:hypothetical protein [Kingella sp. (in: b-proteobacteria)]|uniref:hypothetical protein n=1 Tax=Kingella sp. (in: b-proteobacteria) TaxID=2020713 RepID=UPI0026DDCA76|nr:hypothetical protein [Kingella sp. (in: b-proteobacteria)]MDO4656426.1 hypothetical protein [Kingella sp. (in: b-proteobacteria)]